MDSFDGRALMLVVSRKENESIMIEPLEGIDPSLTLREVFAHGPIRLTLKHVGARRVRIVIQAPSALKIMRSDADAAADAATASAEPTAPAYRSAKAP
jgi:sRNA-binding carbon storage regulator CsrA